MDLQRDIHGWKILNTLGEGGQSKVYLVRSPARQVERREKLAELAQAVRAHDEEKMSEAVWSAVRPDDPLELGALKVFNIPPKSTEPPPPPDYEPLRRLKNEMTALKLDLPGLPKLLDADEDERWIVTEYFPERSLKHNMLKYRGKAIPALKAFRSLLQTVASLHAKNLVHRDIKPPNIFVRGDELVLGDFGIVYLPDEQGRATTPLERVGPRDYMPPWTNLGERVDDVRPTTDVYMLGKLLWSLLDGRAFLPYQSQKYPQFDLTLTFPGNPHMNFINQLLDRSVVEHERDCTLTANEMLQFTNKMIQVAEQGGQLIRKGVPRPCRICGDGFYVPDTVFSSNVPPIRSGDAVRVGLWVENTQTSLRVYPFVCSYCGHLEFFTKSPPS